MARLNKSQIKALPAGTARGDGGNLWVVSSRSGRKRWGFAAALAKLRDAEVNLVWRESLIAG